MSDDPFYDQSLKRCMNGPGTDLRIGDYLPYWGEVTWIEIMPDGEVQLDMRPVNLFDGGQIDLRPGQYCYWRRRL